MRRRRARSGFHEPSLVPLADMLTNTVGVILFISIFTVLTASGVVLAKRLPMERSTDARPLSVACMGGRALPVNRDLIGQFLKPLGQPGSYDAVDGWVKKYNERQIEDEYFVVKGEGEAFYSIFTVSLELAVIFTPREGKGETPAEARQADSRLRQFLKGYQPKDRFIHFTVQPDSLDAFTAAREVAAEMGFNIGWMPMPDKQPLRFSVSSVAGIGYKPGPQ